MILNKIKLNLTSMQNITRIITKKDDENFSIMENNNLEK